MTAKNSKTTNPTVLDRVLIQTELHNGSIVIKNIMFEKGPLGSKELTITWEKLKCYLRLEVIAGPPAKLALVNIDTTEPISAFNNTALLVPLIVQLCDEMGNATCEADVKVIMLTDKGIKPDPSKPVLLNVTFNTKAACQVGELLPGYYTIPIKKGSRRQGGNVQF
ncbi:hypothetical protein QZH41_004955 [Actinostola sp. cb2023]|nr:hypothetical protein QZH41_004955 [Actinostola sp. cb2023]